MNKEYAFELTQKLLKEQFSDADCAIASGSLMRGQGDEFSDVDLIILYRKVPNAYRKSLIFNQLRFECFIHDCATAKYFMRDDQKKRNRALIHMIATGIQLPYTHDIINELTAYAETVLQEGPTPLLSQDLEYLKYTITDLADDLRGQRNDFELQACAVKLYESIVNLFFGVKSEWLSGGKWIAREMERIDTAFANKFKIAFDVLFKEGKIKPALDLVNEILVMAGGANWDIYYHDAPKDWRIDK